jgi:uncharacterized RDD family membrane protein YckC
VVPATQLVTPEAVVLDLPTASVGSRMLCRALDIAVTVVGFCVLAIIAGTVSDITGSGDVAAVAVLFGVFAALLLYPVLMETFWRGRTVGKVVMGLRVVRVDGGPIGFRHAAVRAALGLIDVWATLGGLGMLAIFVSKHDQRLGDMAAGTLFLRERRGTTLRPVQFFVPPGCEDIVRAVDVGGMTTGDYELVRSFLVRWGDFSDLQRPTVAAKVAGPLWQRFRHPVPSWLGPDYYLACLGAAYQLRHPVSHPVPSSPSGRASVGGPGSWGDPQAPQPAGGPQQRGGPQRAWRVELPTVSSDEPGTPSGAEAGDQSGTGRWVPPS